MAAQSTDVPIPSTSAGSDMLRFDIYAHGRLIGWTRLEGGDPPMGVAFGQFHASAIYDELRSLFLYSGGPGGKPVPASSELSLLLPDGRQIQSSGGVVIEDFSDDLGPEGLQVTILGIPYPEYEALFPQHVAAYEAQFRPAR